MTQFYLFLIVLLAVGFVYTTADSSPILSFYSNITISGVTQAELSVEGKDVVALTAATVMNLPSGTVSYIGTISSTTTNRKLKITTEDVTYTIISRVFTQVTMSQTTYTSVDSLYTAATTELTNQVNNNQFTNTLQAEANSSNVPELTNAQATSVDSSAASVNYDSASKAGLNEGAVAGIVISVLFVAAVVASCAYRRYKASSLSQAGPNGTKGYVLNEDDEEIAIDNPVLSYTTTSQDDDPHTQVHYFHL